MFPQTPLPVTGELYVKTLGWVDITPDIRQGTADSGGGVTITRGRSSEGQQTDPGRCSFTLNNRHGKYSPRNPRSDYYDLIGRNTPVRFGIELFRDTFNRTVSGGLGTADSGQAWTASTPARWSVASGKATFSSFSAVNTVEHIVLNNTTCVDSEQVIDVSPSAVMTGASLVVGLMARADASLANGYWLRAEFDPSGTMTAKISRRQASVSTELAVTPVAVSYSAGTAVRFRASVVGSRLAVKIWLASQPEPRDWTLTATDRTFTQAGLLGLRTWLVGGNTNNPIPGFSLDNYKVVDPRFFGEISSWPVRWDISGNDQWVPVQASGLLRRLNQGQKPLSSPIFRNLSQYNPTGYLPLEDGSDSSSPANAVPAGVPGKATDVSFAADDSLPGSATAARLNSPTSSIILTNRPGQANSSWSFLFYFKMDSIPTSQQTLVRLRTTGTVTDWTFAVSNSNYRWTGIDATGATRFSEFSSFGAGAEPNKWIAMQLNVVQSGGSVDAYAFWYSLGMNNFYTIGQGVNDFTGTVGNVSTVMIGPSTLPATSIAHVATFGRLVPFTDYGFTDSTNGYVGETAGRRILRLSAENGIPVDVVGNPDDTESMGRQRADTFLNLVQSCASADGGILSEVKSDLALSYRTRISLYNQTPVSVSYAAGHLSEPFEPVEDDDALRNDVTVTRDGGSSARVARESGPLSILPAPAGVGIYDESVRLNLAYDSQVENQAAWRVHLGTVDEARYPRVRINLARDVWSTDQPLTRRATALDSGDLVSINELPAWLPPGPVALMVQGYTERLDAYTWDVTWNATPGSVWSVATVEGEARIDSDSSVLTSSLSSSATSFSVASAENELWTTSPEQFPLEILVAGERMRVSGIHALAEDTFARTVSSGWGTALTGQTWTTSGGSSSDYSVTGG